MAGGTAVSAALQVNGDPEDAVPAVPAAHTPGPWVWDGNNLRQVAYDPDNSSVHTILMREGGCGYLGSSWRKTLRELDADYALIAAAPELLAALQALLQRVRLDESDLRAHWAPLRSSDANAFDACWGPAVAGAEAAISKATGVQP